ncbi:MAG: hypothetical protein ABI658_13240 [Acidimicrobiales bacterium]
MPIQLIYELVVPPTRLREVHALFAADYLPAARERGMHYAGAYLTPPIELDDAPTTLVLQFTLPDVDAVWAMKRQVTDSVEVADFWRRIDAIVVSRQRRFLAPYDEASDGAV